MIVFPAKVPQKSWPFLPPPRSSPVSDRVAQRVMKSFHLALCLRVLDPSVDQIDPLLDQIHTQASQAPSVGTAPLRSPMIHEHGVGHSVAGKCPSKQSLLRIQSRRPQAKQPHRLARAVVQDRKRMTHAVGTRERPLEFHLPQFVGLGSLEPLGRWPLRLVRIQLALSSENSMHVETLKWIPSRSSNTWSFLPPHPCRRLSSTTRCSTAAGVRRGLWRGRRDRSCSPVTFLASRYFFSQRYPVARTTKRIFWFIPSITFQGISTSYWKESVYHPEV